jgi:hypothetical protein
MPQDLPVPPRGREKRWRSLDLPFPEGFRANLFHLGVVRFLRDAGMLCEITDIASISGGSILAAHLALNWDRYNGNDEAFAGAAGEIVNFVRFDVLNHIVRRLSLLYFPRLLSNLTPCPTRGATANAVFERYYRAQLYGDRCLYELPESPRLHILAINVSNGGLSVRPYPFPDRFQDRSGVNLDPLPDRTPLPQLRSSVTPKIAVRPRKPWNPGSQSIIPTVAWSAGPWSIPRPIPSTNAVGSCEAYAGSNPDLARSTACSSRATRPVRRRHGLKSTSRSTPQKGQARHGPYWHRRPQEGPSDLYPRRGR